MDILKNNRSVSVDAVEFFDHFLKQKRFALIYSPYKELINYGITYEKKNKKSDVAGNSLKIRKKGDKAYTSKNLFFDSNRLVSKQMKEVNNKNVIFMKYRGKLVPYKLSVTKAYFDQISNANDKRTRSKFLFDVFYSHPTEVRNYMFTKSLVFLNNRYPFYLVADGTALIGGVDVYLSPNLYSNNKSFLKNISETGEVVVDSNMLSDLRTQSRDLSYTFAKIHGFKTSQLTSLNVKFEDFVFLDFKIKVKLKGQTSSDPLKIFFELSSTIDKTENEIIVPDDMKTTLKGQSVKKTIKKSRLETLNTCI